MKRTYLVLPLTLLCLAIFTSAQGKSKKKQKQSYSIVKLTPPMLDSKAMLEQIRCTRPVREGMFDISVRTLTTQHGQNKTVFNCCGMGGGGWTTGYGSVEEAVKLLEASNISKKVPIRIIGAGCIGLLTALELTSKGYNVAGITAKELYAIPSWRAAGYYAIVSLKTAPSEEERLNRINLATFEAYQRIEQGKCPYLTKDVVRMMPVYCSEETVSGLEELEANGYIPSAEKVVLDFGNGVTHKNFVKYMTYFMDTTKLMQQMRLEVDKRGITITRAAVASFEDCEEAVIFNCSGLGSRELNQDASITPVRGHLITLNELAGTAHMEYMIYTKVLQDGKEEYVYLFPKNVSVTAGHPEGIPCQGVLGGTFIPDTDQLTPEELEKLDKTAFKRMLERSRKFFYGAESTE